MSVAPSGLEGHYVKIVSEEVLQGPDGEKFAYSRLQ